MTLIAFPSVSSLLSLKNRPSWFIRWMWLLWQTSCSARYQKCFVSVDFLSCTMKAFNNLTAHMFCLLWIWKSSSRTSLWWFNDRSFQVFFFIISGFPTPFLSSFPIFLVFWVFLFFGFIYLFWFYVFFRFSFTYFF